MKKSCHELAQVQKRHGHQENIPDKEERKPVKKEWVVTSDPTMAVGGSPAVMLLWKGKM